MEHRTAEVPDATIADTPRWLHRPHRWFAGASVALALLALLAECCGSVSENVLLGVDVLIVCAWVTTGRPTLPFAVTGVAAVTIGFAWLGGTPEPALFQPVLLAAGVGWRMADVRHSLACALLLAAVPLVGDLGPSADWGWWNWGIGTLFAWSLGRIIRRLERTLAELHDARASLVQAAATEERRRIARDVHDLVGHSLTAMLLNVRAARQALESDPATTAIALDDAERSGMRGLAEVRASLPALRDAAPDRAGTHALCALPDGQAIVDLLEPLRARDDVRLSTRGEVAALSGPVAVATCRVLQECLTNITRHGIPGSGSLTLEVGAERVVLRSDNRIATVDGDRAPGTPSESNGSGAYGLIGMRERVASLGGLLESRRDGRFWRLRVEIPRR